MDDLNGLEWSARSGSPAGANKVPHGGTDRYFGAVSTQQPAPNLGTSRTSTPISAERSGITKASNKSTTDSFANLVSFGSAKTASLTLQQQQERLLAEKAKNEEEKKKQYDAHFGNTSFWEGQSGKAGFGKMPFESNGPTTAPKNSTPIALSSPLNTNPFSISDPKHISEGGDDDLFAAFNADTKVDNSSFYPPPLPSLGNGIPGQDNQLNLSNPASWKQSLGADTLGELQDDDDPFGLGQLARRDGSPHIVVSTANDDDDFLGDLGKPVEEVRRRERDQSPQPGSSSSEGNNEPESADPWDKAVNELVDMGFTAENSRRALTESGAGLNLQAAVGWLLKDAHRIAKEKAQGRASSQLREQSQESSTNERMQDSIDASRNEALPSWMRPEHRQFAASQDASRSPTNSDSDVAARAAAVGSNLFKTANSLWKNSQKRVQKVVADYQQDVDANQPKWMRDTSATQRQRPSEKEPLPNDSYERGRRDDPPNLSVTEEALMLESGPQQQPKRNFQATRSDRVPSSTSSSRDHSPAILNPTREQSTQLPRWQQAAPATALNAKSRLSKQALEEQTAQAYVSPARRKKAAAVQKSSEEPDLLFGDLNKEHPTVSPRPEVPSSKFSNNKPPHARQTNPSPPISIRPNAPERVIPPVSPPALAKSHQYRLAGTEQFKRGDYASALNSYTQSLSSLPKGHPITIVLFCNRSVTAIKTGDPKSAVLDADAALSLIGPGHGINEAVDLLDSSVADSRRSMSELYGKALMRKAEALEQMERWADAGTVWRQAVECGAGGAISLQGRIRCEKSVAPKAPTPRPRTTPPSRPITVNESEAVSRMRAANVAAEKADDEKFALSDAVDARISAWRDGRRDNLRALLGGLDSVLWEGSGWKKIGMHELVMNGKVKINYMKAIAKVHPDKLQQSASTEVKMISSAVFATLNEAWDKFKTENGM